MNNRIQRFMTHKGLSSSELADTIGVQRSNVTHVLHGRNKPSFQFIAKLLESYPEINAKWLIMGQGDMLEGRPKSAQPDLFMTAESIKSKSDSRMPTEGIIEKEPIEYGKAVVPSQLGKEIERIVVFYTDQTFKEYSPSK